MCAALSWTRLAGLLVLFVCLHASGAPPVPAVLQIWDPHRPRPLVLLKVQTLGHREGENTVVGIYAAERVCYVETYWLSQDEELHFPRGATTPSAAAAQWADMIAEIIGKRPAAEEYLVQGHAEPLEAPTPAQAVALSQLRAEAVQALLVARGIAAPRLRLRAMGTADSALLGDRLQRAADWRRVSVEPLPLRTWHGARLFRQRGDQRALLDRVLAAHKANPQEGLGVGLHATTLRIDIDQAALTRFVTPSGHEPLPAAPESVSGLVGALAASECQQVR